MARAPVESPLVWLCDAQALSSPALLAQYREVLDDSERDRLARLRHPASRHQFLVSHALQRSVLGQVLGEAPASLVFSRAPEGKPLLVRGVGESGCAFNLSHSGTLAALAVAPDGFELGVDVEVHRGGRRFEALSRRYFSHPEQQRVSGAGEGEIPGVFYGTWTLKESWLKARGSGIRVPLADFGFGLDAGRLTFSAAAALEESPAQWRFWEWRLAGPASLALAIRDPSLALAEPGLLWGVPLGDWAPLAVSPSASSDW